MSLSSWTGGFLFNLLTLKLVDTNTYQLRGEFAFYCFSCRGAMEYQPLNGPCMVDHGYENGMLGDMFSKNVSFIRRTKFSRVL